MLEFRKEMNPFEKIKVVEEQTKLELPEIDIKKLPLMIGRVSHYIRKNIKNLNENERELYDFIIRHKLNARNLYQIFLLKDAPYDLKKKIIEGKIWIRNALKEMAMIRKNKENPNDRIIIIEIRNIVKEMIR